jgi:protein O-GlcNAc transferase
MVNLANLAREAGDHAEARRLYNDLLRELPDNPMVRRNGLVSLEYDPDVTDEDRQTQAVAWGEWAIAKAGGPHSRPPLRPIEDRPLRVGYVSADFCQHTVGLFVKDVLQAHDPARVIAFAYSAGQVKDWVTEAIRAATQFRDVATLDDVVAAALIRQDQIDVLVDLSGHTAGSRLTVFAHRPAPVQVSWLGYFATTGLSTIDAVLLDDWHALPGTEAQFVEPILRLPGGRFCYQPVPWGPAEVAPPPCLVAGHITFGSFNNTAKLNDGVFDIWSKVLTAVPNSRLVLKWRTFNDGELRRSVLGAFAARGIAPDRIDLRGPSFHADLLKQYADIDIALDPFPFTGGLTSCEALWMGVPVVTCPQGRVVSRQTFAFLSAIGFPELAARNADDYVRIAVALAGNRDRLAALRGDLRARMGASPLMDVAGFARCLEASLFTIHHGIQAGNRRCSA